MKSVLFRDTFYLFFKRRRVFHFLLEDEIGGTWRTIMGAHNSRPLPARLPHPFYQLLQFVFHHLCFAGQCVKCKS